MAHNSTPRHIAIPIPYEPLRMEFTDDEIREELARLGYRDVPDDKLLEFKKG